MRPIWKGHISFGLVNIPVTLFSAERRNNLSLHLLDRRDHSRVRYKRVNAETGEETPWDEIVRGYEYDKDNYVVMDEDELKRAAPEKTQTIDIDSFVDLDEIDPMFFDKPYYLEPGKKGEKGYALLRETMRESGKAGVAKVVIRTREYLAAMLPREGALVLNVLRYADELRSIDEIDAPGDDLDALGVTKQERKMASTLVEGMAGEWEPTRYRDEYREEVMRYVESKIETGEVSEAPTAEESDAPAPINMMEALKRSVAETKGRRKGGSSSSSSSSGGSKRSSSKKRSTRKKAG